MLRRRGVLWWCGAEAALQADSEKRNVLRARRREGSRASGTAMIRVQGIPILTSEACVTTTDDGRCR